MDSLIRRASEIHSASGVARTLLNLMQNENFSASELGCCIEKDPALALRVLATVNSVRYGAVRRISSIQQAVAMLGRGKLRTIVLTFSVMERLTHGVAARVYSEYWKRSLTTSLVANALAVRRQVDVNDAYTAGLLADIGILVLAQFEPDRYLTIFDQNPHGPALIAAEQSEFGFDHAALGARLLEVWNFPQSLVMAVETHHDNDESESLDLSCLVRAGSLMPGAIWSADSESFRAAYDYFLNHFDFNIDTFVSLATDVNDLVEEEARTYSVEGVKAVDCESLQSEARDLLNLMESS